MDEGLEQYAEVAACECGSSWWNVEGCSRPDCTCDQSILGVVALDGLGRVIAHHGMIVCAECGADVQLPQLAHPITKSTNLKIVK